jgi:hypothetical protein
MEFIIIIIIIFIIIIIKGVVTKFTALKVPR